MSRVERTPTGETKHMSRLAVKRTIITFSAALTLSAATVGATVSPAQAGVVQAHGGARG